MTRNGKKALPPIIWTHRRSAFERAQKFSTLASLTRPAQSQDIEKVRNHLAQTHPHHASQAIVKCIDIHRELAVLCAAMLCAEQKPQSAYKLISIVERIVS